MTLQDVYLQKRLKLLPKGLPPKGNSDSRATVAALQKNLEALGFSLSRKLALALAELGKPSVANLGTAVLNQLKESKGAHVNYRPMYPNFPEQVMEMSELELYWRALFHYITLGDPNTEDKRDRLPLSEKLNVTVIDLGTEGDLAGVLTELAAANSSLSQSDKDALVALLNGLDDPASALPDSIPQKETLALIAATLLARNPSAELTGLATTATDVLRIVTQLSGGDISLAEKTSYKNFSRPLRKTLLLALENCGASLEEDMLRHKGKWIRLGEKLHPGQYGKKFPRTLEAFRKLRNEVAIPTFASKTEAALKDGSDWESAARLLASRPGDFLRRLDHMLRTYSANATAVLTVFLDVADACSTPALLGLREHFVNRQEKQDTRQVFPKGSTSKMKVIPTPAKNLRKDTCEKAIQGIEHILKARFAKLPKLGRVFIHPDLALYPVPFAQRSAAKALRTLPRGSHAPLDADDKKDTLRFFIWWKNMPSDKPSSGITDSFGDYHDEGRVDIDLSCAFLKEDFSLSNAVTYYNLRDIGGTHSGDVVTAPNGACEFIDISIDKVLTTGARYVAAVIKSYTGQPFRNLPECFCGWMTRDHAQHGEVFEAKTVQNKADLAGDTCVAIPVIIDLQERKAIWADIALTNPPSFPNNVEANKGSISLVCKNIASLKRPTLHTLLRLHAEARGTLTDNPEKAETVFNPDFAYEGTKITGDFLSN